MSFRGLPATLKIQVSCFLGRPLGLPVERFMRHQEAWREIPSLDAKMPTFESGRPGGLEPSCLVYLRGMIEPFEIFRRLIKRKTILSGAALFRLPLYGCPGPVIAEFLSLADDLTVGRCLKEFISVHGILTFYSDTVQLICQRM